MKHSRYCKFHYLEGESEHWAVLDRKSFASKGAKPHFTQDTPLAPNHLKLELGFDWDEERVWGKTTYDLTVKAEDVREIVFDAVHLDIKKVTLGNKSTEFDNNSEQLIIPLKKDPAIGKKLKVIVKIV